MRQLEFAPGSFDLIWSEGAIYNIGFRAGLEAWRPLLVKGGCMAVSEATWLTEDRPAEARAFWQEGYPALMVTDTAPFRYAHYHSGTDTPERIDYPRLARLTAALTRVIADLAR